MKDLPDRILWHNTKERPKTLYLLEGFRRLGIEVVKTNRLVMQYDPPKNPRGLYVYPIGMVFGEKRPIAFLDINTVPRMFFGKFEARAASHKNSFYFKTHLHRLDRHRAIVAPNSPSIPDAFLAFLDGLRKKKDRKEYLRDFFFIGWHDDRGLRMQCVRTARRQPWKVLAGLMPFKHHTTVPESLQLSRMAYLDHLQFQCSSKLSLALPGGRALPYCSFRHVELWGMGCAMLTVSPDAVLPGDPKECWIEFRRDMSDFVKVVNYYLRHNEERERIALRGREYFDKYLTPEANARWIIDRVHERIMK